MSYAGRSHLKLLSGGERILDLAPNLARDKVEFNACLADPIRFREAISALHDVVINDLTFTSRDKAGYEDWKKQQVARESALRKQARESARETVRAGNVPRATAEQQKQHQSALARYWQARSQLNTRLREENQTLWRRRVPKSAMRRSGRAFSRSIFSQIRAMARA